MSWREFLRPEVLVFLIPIVAIIVGGLVKITQMVIRHRERIAMIEHGMDPDAPRREDRELEGEDRVARR